jgi:hypothetical protein
MTSDESTRLDALASRPQTILPSMRTVASFLEEDGYPVVCSFDLATPEGRELQQKCEIDETEKLADWIGMPFRIEHVYATHVDKAGRVEGEYQTIRKICIVNTEGHIFHCFSGGIAQSIMRLIAGHGMPPWPDGLDCEIREQRLPNKRVKFHLAERFAKVAEAAK